MDKYIINKLSDYKWKVERDSSIGMTDLNILIKLKNVK